MPYRFAPHVDFLDRPDPGQGSVGSLSQASPERGSPVACLYVPNVENRSGWREWWVYRTPETPEVRLLGFRGRRGK